MYMPNQNYKKVDVVTDDLSFISDYDIVVTNALLDVLDMPTLTLERIYYYRPKYIILHRQVVSYDESEPKRNLTGNGFNLLTTYGNHPTPNSIIHIWTLNWLVRTFGYKAIKSYTLNEEEDGQKIRGYSYLFEINEDLKWDGKGETRDDDGNEFVDKDGKKMRKLDNGEMVYE